MLTVLGALCLVGGGIGMGLGVSAQQHQQICTLRSFIAALEQLERELTFRLSPMPELLENLASSSPAPAGEFFRRCQENLSQLGAQSFEEIWRQALRETAQGLTDPYALAAVAGLGAVLGRYDGQHQQKALLAVRETLVRCAAQGEEVWSRLRRVHLTLGASGGAVLALLLL